MSAALRLREDYGAPELRALARASRDADQTRRLLALAAIYEGASRGAAAEIGGVQRQTVRDWVAAFNVHGPSGLIDGQAPGQRPLLGPEQRAALRRIVEAGPDPAVDGLVRWRLIDLAQWIFAEFGIASSRPGRAITPRTPPRRRLSKRVCRPLGRDRPRRRGWPADRGVVFR
jgi:transposase